MTTSRIALVCRPPRTTELLKLVDSSACVIAPADAVRGLERGIYDVLVLEHDDSAPDALTTASQVRARGFGVPIILLAQACRDPSATTRLDLILCAPQPAAELLATVRRAEEVSQQRARDGEAVAARMAERFGLSRESREVIAALASGHPKHSLGRRLSLSQAGLNSRLARIRNTLEIDSVEHLYRIILMTLHETRSPAVLCSETTISMTPSAARTATVQVARGSSLGLPMRAGTGGGNWSETL